MKRIFTSALFLITYSNIAFAQTWQLLPNAPAAEYVNDDIFFINENKGWNLDGFIYRTQDGVIPGIHYYFRMVQHRGVGFQASVIRFIFFENDFISIDG